MIALLKAIPFGIFLTIVVSLFIGSAGASGGTLRIFSFPIDIPEAGLDFRMYWSWILFLAGTGLTWVILLMMGD